LGLGGAAAVRAEGAAGTEQHCAGLRGSASVRVGLSVAAAAHAEGAAWIERCCAGLRELQQHAWLGRHRRLLRMLRIAVLLIQI
jgi:hypothetical protein